MIVGQLFFANASKKIDAGLISVFGSTDFWLAVIIYGVASVAWVFLLRIVPVNIAYPSASAVTSIMLYILVAVNRSSASPIRWSEILGILLLTAGLFLIYGKRV